MSDHLPSHTEPTFMEGGGLSVDDRGEVAYVNGFSFQGVKRFYTLSNHRQGFIRAWHAHRREAKYVLVVAGAALVGAVPIVGDWAQPDRTVKTYRFAMSAKKPAVLYIPPGYANGAMSLTPDATVMYFSTATMEETKGDDVRYDARYWDIWNVEER
ncbi:dTDP-4-dehydrorhamnose 3,5-epimerase family protein [Candidatus Uhrbacteria bacterium]|nr:dTDP-4-dehydrorhamnose 3,5-epimerase family protein [Candidatus Uhrbacteria bacterium]